MSDARALAWLDRLLEAQGESRAAQLATLATADPPLHERLVRLLAAALAGDSQVLAQPVVELQAPPSPPELLQPGQSLASYKLLRELGRGGMSVVWAAERAAGVVERQVALKLPLCAVRAAADVARFEREQRVLAQLTHPHIARLYDAGVAESGQPFIVLELIDGLPITKYCDTHRLDIGARLRLFQQVLSAVDHAHRHLIVHRDLKPSNILVDASGQVKLLDFGIAKLLKDPQATADLTELTQLGKAVMTPSYAAPEQAEGQPISTASDIYVLGVLLHELLTGVLPYGRTAHDPASLSDVLSALKHGVTRRPSDAPFDDATARLRAVADSRRLRTVLKGDLDTIVLRALRRSPVQRYASVQHLQDDLQRFLERRPILARPHTFWYATGLLLRRHRNASVAAALGATLSLFAGVLAVQQHQESRLQEARATTGRDFMFQFVADFERDELQPDRQVTGKDMIDRAVQRARMGFEQQPQLQGEVLTELGRMYLRLGELASSRTTMNEALHLLEGAAPPDDPALSRARGLLSYLLFANNELEPSRALAIRARDRCTRRGTECAKARGYANDVLAKLLAQEGNIQQALLAGEGAVRELTQGFGVHHPEVALARLALAATARNAGRFEEAQRELQQALADADGATLLVADRQALQQLAAVLELDLGRYEAAREALTRLLAATDSSSRRAVRLRMLATVFLALGDPEQARAAATEAMTIARAEDNASGVRLARHLRAQALALLGQPQMAFDELSAVVAEMRAAGDSRVVVSAVRRAQAEVLLRMRDPARARELLESLRAEIMSAPEPFELQLGLVLDLRGCAERELGLSAAALQSHEQGRIELQKKLPPGHPFLQRNTLYRAAAAGDALEFQRQAERLEARLPAVSVWRELIDAHRDPAACHAAALEPCVLVL